MRGLGLCALLALSGCYKINYLNGGSPGASSDDDTMHLGLVFGLVELDEEDASAICPNGISAVEQEMGIVDWLIGSLSGQIVVTRTMKFHCADGSASLVGVDEDGKAVAWMDAPGRLTPAL